MMFYAPKLGRPGTLKPHTLNNLFLSGQSERLHVAWVVLLFRHSPELQQWSFSGLARFLRLYITREDKTQSDFACAAA